MAFYKIEDGVLLVEPTSIVSLDYTLFADIHDEYEYPVYGWYWFDTEEEAKAFFGIE